MHPFCRSTTAPVIDEEFLTSRRAKNPKTGEYDEIPPEMNYKQWKEKYVEGKENVEPVKQEQVKTDTPNGYEIKLENKNADNQYFDTPLESKTSEFDSKDYENRVKKQAEKREEKIEPATKANKALLEKVENNKDNLPEGLVKEIKSTIEKNKELNEAFNELSNRNLKKNIELPNELLSAKEIPDDIKLEIKRVIEEVEKEYNVRLDIIEYKEIKSYRKAVMQFAPIEIDGILKTRLIINQGYDWDNTLEEFNKRIEQANSKKELFDKSVADLIYHEMAHVMTFQDCKTYKQYKNEVLILWKQHIYFPNCGYCNEQEDGAEDIAEGFVAMKNNIDIPDRIKDMVESFIKRKKIK